MDQNKIGKFIAARRKEHGMTQVELAEKLGITNKAVSKWETGKCLPDAALFDDICILLNITLNELFSGEKIAPENIEKKAEENLKGMAAEFQKRDYRIIVFKYFTIILAFITISVNISVGEIYLEGTPVFSNLFLTALLLVSWGVLSYFTKKESSMQKLVAITNAILFVSAITAFILNFWDANSRFVFWIGFPCEVFFYGFKFFCDRLHIYAATSILAAVGIAFSKKNLNLSNQK